MSCRSLKLAPPPPAAPDWRSPFICIDASKGWRSAPAGAFIGCRASAAAAAPAELSNSGADRGPPAPALLLLFCSWGGGGGEVGKGKVVQGGERRGGWGGGEPGWAGCRRGERRKLCKALQSSPRSAARKEALRCGEEREEVSGGRWTPRLGIQAPPPPLWPSGLAPGRSPMGTEAPTVDGGAGISNASPASRC